MTKPSALIRKFVRLACAPAPALVFLALVGSAHAQTVMVSNLEEPAGGNGAFTNLLLGGEPYVLNVASDFTTGAEATTLYGITLLFGEYSAGSGFVLSLYSDGGGQPGSLLETLSGSDSPNDATTYNYISAGGTSLEANTTYWWVGSDGDGQFNHPNSYSSAETSVGGWSIGDFSSFTQTNGGEWLSTGGAQTMFSVSVAAVPEPNTYAALAGVATLLYAARRRANAKKMGHATGARVRF